MDKIIVTILGIFGIGFVYWFFLMKKESVSVVVDSEINIKVDGGYLPNNITIPYGKTTRLHFFRKDPSNCLEEVILSEYKIRKFLPLNSKTTLAITPHKRGTFLFSCGMGMFHGKLTVK